MQNTNTRASLTTGADGEYEIRAAGQTFTLEGDIGCIQLLSSAFLGAIVRGDVDLEDIAWQTLADRGHDDHGRRIGLDAAEERLAAFRAGRAGDIAQG